MTKLLRFLGLTTIISSTSVLTLTHSNNNQNFLTNQSINSNETNIAVIDNINKSMNATTEGSDKVIVSDNYYDYKTINLPWVEAQKITSGIVTNNFKLSLPKGEENYTELHLKLAKKPEPDSINLSGKLWFEDFNEFQVSDVFVWIHLIPIKDKPNLTFVAFSINFHARDSYRKGIVSTSGFIDKITLS